MGSFFYAYLTIPLMEKSIFRFERKVGMKESKVKVWFEENKDKICAEVRLNSVSSELSPPRHPGYFLLSPTLYYRYPSKSTPIHTERLLQIVSR